MQALTRVTTAWIKAADRFFCVHKRLMLTPNNPFSTLFHSRVFHLPQLRVLMKVFFAVILFTSWLHTRVCISINELVRMKSDGLRAISDTSSGPFKSGFGGVKLPLNLSDLQYHGTTTLSFKHQDAIIVCIDSKASVGDYVGSRTVRKVFPVAKSIVATMAGGAADCEHWIRRISRDAKAFEYQYDADLNAKAIARLLSSELKERHRAREGSGCSMCPETFCLPRNNVSLCFF